MSIDKLFEQAARNQGFENLAELVKVSSWQAPDIDPAAIASDMNDPAAAPMVLAPEHQAQFDAWQKARRQSK